ncbi:MAG: hypothetical protein ABSG70_05950 [Terriglobales bacterium]|jgi:hypothetical protein
MRRRTCYLKLILVSVAVLLCGCDQSTVRGELAPHEDEAAARRYFDLLRHREFDEFEKDVDPGLQVVFRGTLTEMAEGFPDQEPLSVKVVERSTGRLGDSELVYLALEYEFPRKWVLARITLRKEGVAPILGLQVVPMDDSLEHRNRFTLAGKSQGQYAVLLLAAATGLLCSYASIICLRNKLPWYWALISMVGLGQLAVNWTTGETSFSLGAISFPPAQASASAYGPWMISVTLPVGAVLFLMLRDRLRSGPRNDGSTESTTSDLPPRGNDVGLGAPNIRLQERG